MKRIRYLLLLIPFLFPIKAHAAVNGYSDFFGNLDSEFQISANSSRSGSVRFTSNGNFSDNFIYADVCTTGNAPTLYLTNYTYGSGQPSTKWYKVDTPCRVSGYNATVYRQIIYITSTSYEEISGYQPLYSFYASGTLFSNTNYNSFLRILNLGVSPTVPLEDIIYSQNETEISVLNDILNQLRNSSSQTQQVIDSNNAIKQQIQEANQKQQETNQKLDDIDGTLKDDNTQQAQDSAGSFFNDFTTDTHGLTAIITAPLSLISKITSASCSPLVIPLPYVDKDLTLPCMGAIYSDFFGSFLSIYQVITFGMIAYWVCVRIFNLVKDFKNPDHDEIEVLDL